MMEDFRIRRCEPADQSEVVALILSIQREEFGIAITAADQPDLRDIADFYQREAGDFWVAAIPGDGIVGTIALKDIGGGAAALRKMFVHPAYRGTRGVARALLEALLDHARARGLARIWLGTTDRFHAAHRFYARHGFEQVAPGELPPSFPRMAVDTRFYARTL